MSKPAVKTDAWMPLWIGAYLADTQHLSREQHGAYLLLIMAYWRGAAPLPDDDRRLASIVKASLREWKALRPVLAEFFRVGDGLWRHKRVDQELDGAAKNKAQKSVAGKASAVKRWGNGQHNENITDVITDVITEEVTDKVTDNERRGNPTPTPSPTPYRGEEGARARAKLAEQLRKLGVNITAANPYLAAWLLEGYGTGQILAALEIARQSKPAPAAMPAKYLDTVLRSPQAAPKRKRSLHDERAATIAELTGASRPAGTAAEREPIESAARRVG